VKKDQMKKRPKLLESLNTYMSMQMKITSMTEPYAQTSSSALHNSLVSIHILVCQPKTYKKIYNLVR
jgi:hypothetical protein